VKSALWIPLVVALAAAMPMVGCSSTRTTESTGQYIDSAAITSKVKAALLNEASLKSFQITVDAFKDEVQLSGFVNSDEVKAHAGEVVAGVAGVRSAKDLPS